MADNTEDFGTNGEERDDAFDEMLDRAEADLEDDEAEEAADYEDDENEDGEEGATRSVGHVISDEMRAAALIDPDPWKRRAFFNWYFRKCYERICSSCFHLC